MTTPTRPVHPYRKAVITAAAVALSAVALSACGGSDEEPAATDSGTLRITTLGLCNEVPVYWAEKNGIFADNGLKVELVKSTGGAAALTALQSGDIDLAFTNPFSTMIGRLILMLAGNFVPFVPM